MESNSFNIKGIDFEKKGDKTLKGSFFGNLMKGKSDRSDEAKELYQQAANCYKLAQNHEKALECYQKCINCSEQESENAQLYREAANCVKESDPDKYVEFIQKSIELYSLSGRTGTAATMSKECAQLLEEQYDYEKGILFYSKAAQLYQLDNQSTQSQQMQLKANDLKIQCKMWDELIPILKSYQSIAKKYLAVPILKSSAKDLLFLNVLCFLAMQDLVGAKKNIQAHCIDDANFDGSREHQLLEKMVKSIEEGNRDQYSLHVSEFNQITPLSKAKSSLLVKIKELYLPEDSNQFVTDEKEIDFTGAVEEQINSKIKQGQANFQNDIDFT